MILRPFISVRQPYVLRIKIQVCLKDYQQFFYMMYLEAKCVPYRYQRVNAGLKVHVIKIIDPFYIYFDILIKCRQPETDIMSTT